MFKLTDSQKPDYFRIESQEELEDDNVEDVVRRYHNTKINLAIFFIVSMTNNYTGLLHC
jgi:hypothetical protein